MGWHRDVIQAAFQLSQLHRAPLSPGTRGLLGDRFASENRRGPEHGSACGTVTSSKAAWDEVTVEAFANLVRTLLGWEQISFLGAVRASGLLSGHVFRVHFNDVQ